MGYAATLTEEEAPLAEAALPTTEEWVSTIVRLKNPKAQEMLLWCRTDGEISLDHMRRLAVLLDSPSPRARWIVCKFFWGSLDLTSRPDEEARRDEPLDRSPENRLGPPDYPRLDEHVAYWRAYYR